MDDFGLWCRRVAFAIRGSIETGHILVRLISK